MKKIIAIIALISILFTIAGCSSLLVNITTDDKIFANDINSAFTSISKEDGTFYKDATKTFYDALVKDQNLTDAQKANIQTITNKFVKYFFANAKCNSVTVTRKDLTANVKANITLNKISDMMKDYKDAGSKMTTDMTKLKTQEEMATYLNTTVSNLDQKLINYYIYVKIFNDTFKIYDIKKYDKPQDIQLTYVYNEKGKIWKMDANSNKIIQDLFKFE